MVENYWVSQHNDNTATMARKIKFYDTSLRDGEQTVGVSFSAEEKLRIAQMLERAGVERIEVGMPVVSPEDLRAAKMIVAKIRRSQLFAFCRATKKDVDACLEAGVRAITCELPTSYYKWKAYGYSEERVFDMLTSTIKYAKSNGLFVAFFTVDATRSDLGVLERAYKTAVQEAGADEVVFVDTMGAATPATMARMTKLVKSWVSVPVMVHCHNDFGLATACTIASLAEGAECAQVTVNGLGEKAGNADLAEVALAAKLLYGFEVSIDLTQLYPLSRKVAESSGVPISLLKPVVGEGIFTKESGVAVAQLLTYPPAVETYDPQMVGRTRNVVLSKKSGKGSIQYVLREMGEQLDEGKLDNLLKDVKELGVRKKGTLTREEFKQLLTKYKNGD